MKWKPLYTGIAVVAGLAIAGVVANSCSSRAVQKWKDARDSALAVADARRVEIDSLHNVITHTDAFVNTITKVIVHRDTVLVHDIAVLVPAAALPDTCKPAVLARDSIIVTQGLQIRDSRLAKDSAMSANVNLRAITKKQEGTITDLQKLVKTVPLGRTFWQKITPHPAIGGLCGITTHRGFDCVAGAGLAWTF